MDAKCPIRLYFSPKGSLWQAPGGPERQGNGQMKTFWGHWGPKWRTFWPKYCQMCHLACIQVFLVHFFTKHKSTGWPKASECPKMHIYGQMRAHWSKSIGANSITIIKGPKWGPCKAQNNVKWVSKHVFKCVSSIFHETSQLASNGPKGPIYGQMRALWGHRGPQLRVL